jgi:replicative DNA helicase
MAKSVSNKANERVNRLQELQPQNIEAEQSVLGSLLIDQNAIVLVGDRVRSEDFYKTSHQKIYGACLALYEKQEPIDLLNLTSVLEERNQLEAVGGRTYLAELASLVPTTAHVKSYADNVQRKATLRRLITAAQQIERLGYQEDEQLEKLLDDAEQQLFAVSQKYLKQHFVPIQDLLTETFERIDELHREGGKIRGLPTGFAELDAKLAGLQRSDLVILAARPSVGKTSLALDIGRYMAVSEKVPVGIFSLEMSKEQIADRLLCADAGVGLWKMRTGRLSDKEDEYGGEGDFSRLGHAFGRLSEAKIHIDDSATATVMEMRTKARRLSAEQGLQMLIVDYLQLVDAPGRSDNRVQELSLITRSLKALARELNIPLLVLSQLSRAVESRGEAIPRLADLRDSGSIEQDADVVMFIYRKVMDKSIKQVSEDERHIARINIAKHRNGPTGNVDLYFDEDTVSFKNLARNEQSNGELS